MPGQTPGRTNVSLEAFAQSGHALLPALLGARTCEAIARRIRTSSISGGTRNLLTRPWCAALVERLRREPRFQALVPGSLVAIQCNYFEKSAARNWSVPAHQDLGVPVAERVDDAGLGGWSRKEGELFVQAPVELLEALVAVRVHLEDCTACDGPLKVLPGSHLLGRLSERELAELRRATPDVVCTAKVGDALVMRPLLVHSSTKAAGSSRRRILHLVFGPRIPGHGLRWRQVA